MLISAVILLERQRAAHPAARERSVLPAKPRRAPQPAAAGAGVRPPRGRHGRRLDRTSACPQTTALPVAGTYLMVISRYDQTQSHPNFVRCGLYLLILNILKYIWQMVEIVVIL